MRRLKENSGFYFMLVALVVVAMASGCAKKQVPLNPPKVQATSGDSEGGGPGGGEISSPQAGGASASAVGSSKDGATDGIKEDTLSEASSSFPKGSFRPGESYLSGGSPGDGNLAPGSGSAFGEGSRAGGLGDFAPGSAQSGDLDIAKMIPFKETSDLGDIHFKFDKYDLDVLAKKTLAKNAQWLKTHPNVKVEVQGHSDERGTNNYNLGLGERRALSTKKYLMALGVSGDRLFTISYGEERPFCKESNENCWWQNRRGHFLVSR